MTKRYKVLAPARIIGASLVLQIVLELLPVVLTSYFLILDRVKINSENSECITHSYLVTWNSHFEKIASGIPGIPGNSRESKGIPGIHGYGGELELVPRISNILDNLLFARCPR
jgi:hypothetical protein